MKGLRLPIAELEAMTPHQLSDLLASVVLILRRLPDVPVVALGQNSTLNMRAFIDCLLSVLSAEQLQAIVKAAADQSIHSCSVCGSPIA